MKNPEESKPLAGSTTMPPLTRFAVKGGQEGPAPSALDETRAAEPKEKKAALRSMFDSDEDVEGEFQGYKIKRQIGRGGMAKVFEAESGRSGVPKRVAIKFLQIDDATTRSRFFEEANLIRKIDHPNVIKIFESGEIRGMPYLVMEYLEGTALSDLIQNTENRAIPVERALRMAIQICDGLQQAHEKGIIHRDIKPDNIFVLKRAPNEKQDRVKILDFGIARIVNLDFPDAPRITREGSTIGTPHYMSPESIRGDVKKDKEPGMDIYSLGISLYEMITGHRPFTAQNIAQVLIMHLKKKPELPRKRRPDLDIPEDVETLVMRAMAKKPSQRFQTMVEMKKEIEKCLDPSLRLPRWQRMTRKYGLVAALGITLAAGGVHFKDEIKRVFIGDEKPKVTMVEKAKKDRIYVAKIKTDVPGVKIYEENQREDGKVVSRFREKTGEKPLELYFMGERTVYLELEGYKRARYVVTPLNRNIEHTMEKR